MRVSVMTMIMTVPAMAIAVLVMGRRSRKTLCFSGRDMMARPHFAQHAFCYRTPNG